MEYVHAVSYTHLDGDAKGSKDADSEKTDDASTDESSDTDEETEDTESTDDASADNTDKGEAPDGNGDGQGAPDGEAPSMLNLTGEEQEITVTDSTVITKQSMGCLLYTSKIPRILTDI